MSARSWLLVAGVLAVAGLSVVLWKDLSASATGPTARSGPTTRPDSARLVSAAVPVKSAARPAPDQSVSIAASPQSPDLLAMTNPLASLKREEFAAITARPLFSPNRRPPQKQRVLAKPPVMKPKPKPVRPVLALSMVGAITNSSKRVVIFKDKQTGRHISASKDASIRGWRVVDIQPSSVVLIKDRWEVRLDIFDR